MKRLLFMVNLLALALIGTCGVTGHMSHGH
jgi:hypothetical protein